MPYKDPIIRKEKGRERSARWVKNNPEKARAKGKRYREKNHDKVLSRTRKWRLANREKALAATKRWKKENPEKVLSQKRRWGKEKYHSDIQHKLTTLLRSRLRLALKNEQKVGSAVKDLGCTIPELKIYLEKMFLTGMTWDNWSMKGWHIDHKIPFYLFNLSDPIQFAEACHYTNLQPLWAEVNLEKNKYIT